MTTTERRSVDSLPRDSARVRVGVDPVCGAQLSRRGARFDDHEGQRFYFCSEECRRRFVAEPWRFCVSCVETK
jgi:YHS domain-containing protein